MNIAPILPVRFFAVLLAISLGMSVSAPVRADAAGERRRAQLAKVQRVVVIPPFFGTETLNKIEEQKAHPEKSKPDAKLTEYATQLRSLQDHEKEWLPKRIEARTNFHLVPEAELMAALKELKLTPQSLFQNGGKMKGTSFAPPDAVAVRTLAAHLKADAVLLATMDEPRRNNGGYQFDPLEGLSYDSPKVRGKIGFWLLLPDGTEVLRQAVEVLHPMSKIGSRTYILTDWTETEDQVVEDFLDELTRYIPLKTK